MHTVVRMLAVSHSHTLTQITVNVLVLAFNLSSSLYIFDTQNDVLMCCIAPHIHPFHFDITLSVINHCGLFFRQQLLWWYQTCIQISGILIRLIEHELKMLGGCDVHNANLWTERIEPFYVFDVWMKGRSWTDRFNRSFNSFSIKVWRKSWRRSGKKPNYRFHMEKFPWEVIVEISSEKLRFDWRTLIFRHVSVK